MRSTGSELQRAWATSNRARYGVVIQADELLPRSVVIVAPTSRRARSASFRPEIAVAGDTTRVLVEQLRAVVPPSMSCGATVDDDVAGLGFGGNVVDNPPGEPRRDHGPDPAWRDEFGGKVLQRVRPFRSFADELGDRVRATV